MALVKCPECGRDVSDQAAACPGCGYALRVQVVQPKDPGKPLALAGIAVFAVGVAWLYFAHAQGAETGWGLLLAMVGAGLAIFARLRSA